MKGIGNVLTFCCFDTIFDVISFIWQNEERAAIIKAWAEMEVEVGDPERITNIKRMLPQQVKKRRPIFTEDVSLLFHSAVSPLAIFCSSFAFAKLCKINVKYLFQGEEAGMEEYWDYVFPEDQSSQPNLKLLQRAKMWKMKRQKEGGEGGEGEMDLT